MATNNAINLTASGMVSYDGAGVFAGRTLTEGAGIDITNGDGVAGNPTITFDVTEVGAIPTSIGTDSGTATPATNAFTIVGGTGISTSAATSVVTITLDTPVSVANGGTGAVTLTGVLTGNGTSAVTATAVTQYSPVIGGASNAVASVAIGSAGQVLQSSGAGVAAAYSTATYPLTTTVSQLLYSSATNVVSGLATANKAVITTNATGIPVATAIATDGQIIIGSTAGAPAAATLTAGSGISVVNAGNSITIAATGGSFTWNDVTGTSDDFVANNGYIANNAGLVTITLPATATLGDEFRITGLGSGGWAVAQNASQLIHIGSSVTTTGIGGSLASTDDFDTLHFVCVATNTTFNVISSMGNITIV